MFLKHRKWLHWGSFVLAILCLSLGDSYQRVVGTNFAVTTTMTAMIEQTTTVAVETETEGLEETSVAGSMETTAIAECETMETTAGAVIPPAPEEEYTTAIAEEEGLNPTTGVVSTTIYAETEPGVLPTIVPQRKTLLLGRCLSAIGLLMAAAFVVLFPQTKPYLGPEAEMFLGVVSVWYLSNNSGYIFYSIYDTGLFMTMAMTCILLFCLRGLWSWLWRRFQIKWLLPHRMGLLLSENMMRPQHYVLVHILWVAVLAALIGAATLEGFWNQFPWWTPPGYRWMLSISLGVFGVFTVFSMMNYAKETQHLTRQIRRLTKGEAVEKTEGIFAGEENALASLQKTHEEAVKSAVTSERFKVELISNVSHDLRTPLTSILGYGELLKKEELSQDGKEQLNNLNQKAGYMKELVEELFELTKVSSGIIESKQEKIDLIRLLEQTLGLADDQLQAAELTVRRHYPAEQIAIITDGTRMHQVFANLLGNAVKYALKGTRIHLLIREEEDGYIVRMSNIASYEMDFDPDEILQRFARGDKARSTQGSGLGLAIAQTYTESVGGSFHVEIDGDQFSAVVMLPKAERDL